MSAAKISTTVNSNNNSSSSSNEMNVCADCGQTDPTWASINHGVLVCDQCAIVHRSLGRFISQIKSLKCTDWKPSQLQMVFDLYRSGANSIWEHTLLDPHLLSSSSSSGSHALKGFGSSHSAHRLKKPNPNDALHPTKSDFIRAKYQLFAFVNKTHSVNKDDPESEAEISEQLHSSVRTPNLKTSLRLLAAGANPNYIHSEKFNSPLHMAAKSGQIAQIELLLVYGANLTKLDSKKKTAIDYAREAGHIEIVNRLVEHQFDLTDSLTRFICLGRQPNHQIGEHFLIVDIRPECMNAYDGGAGKCESEKRKNQNLHRNELHQSIQSLNQKSFQELTRDIYDEIDRREINAFVASHYANGDGGGGKLSPNYQQLILPFLPVYQFFSSTRNQGRQKLALLNTKEFTLLIVDMLNEIRRRLYGFSSILHLRATDGFVNVTKMKDEFDVEDDSEPLYDTVPSEADYDECNEVVPSSMPNGDSRLPAPLINGVRGVDPASYGKNFVSMNEYALLKDQMLKSATLMEQFFIENKDMRSEIQRLQCIVEKLVDENVKLRQLVIAPTAAVASGKSSSNSLNNIDSQQQQQPQLSLPHSLPPQPQSQVPKSNSAIFESNSEHFNRGSFLRGSNRVRPQSISYAGNQHSNASGSSNRFSNECITMKTPSSIVPLPPPAPQHTSLSHSPSKSSNSSLLNFHVAQTVATPPPPPPPLQSSQTPQAQQQPQQPSQPQHNSVMNAVASIQSGAFANSSHSSSSSLSSQPHPNTASISQPLHQQHQQQQQQQQQQQHQQPQSMPSYLESSSYAIPASFANLNSHSNVSLSSSILSQTPTHKNFAQQQSQQSNSSAPLPSKEDVIKKIEFITNSIKELLSNAREGKHEDFSICSERICSSVSEMISLFPESLGGAKVENLMQVNQALMVLQENAFRLHDECNSYELNALLPSSIYHKYPQLNHHHNSHTAAATNQDYRFIYNSVIDKAAEVASSVKVIVSHYSC